MKLNLTKSEVKDLNEQLYFTNDEQEVMKYWLLDYTIIKTSEIMKVSTSTVSRIRKSILNKIKRATK